MLSVQVYRCSVPVHSLVWVLFILFTSLHLFANYSAVTSVRMETFNQARLHLVVASSLTAARPSTQPGLVARPSLAQPGLAARPSLAQPGLAARPSTQPGLLLRGADDYGTSDAGHVMSVQRANQLEPVLWSR